MQATTELAEKLIAKHVSFGYGVSKKQLRALFAVEEGASLEVLKKHGGPAEFAARMMSSVTDGIETITIPKRIELFGDNKPRQRRRRTFFEHLLSTSRDPTLRILMLSACALLIAGLVDEGWIEGLSVFFAVSVILFISSIVDMVQESRFRMLSAKIDEVTCTVIRDAHEQEISIYDLVVGDVLIVKTGMILPCDGIFLEAYAVRVDESQSTGETRLVKKDAFKKSEEMKGSPFGRAGTMIEEGSGALLVCAVGRFCTTVKIESSIESSERRTPLQKKLIGISDKIGQVGVAFSIAILVLLLLHSMIEAYIESKSALETIKSIVENLVVAVMLIVVSVPEGLSFAMKLSLSHSVQHMKSEQTLVRHLRACETMGEITDICLGKTGVLTENHMAVAATFVEGVEVQRESDRDFTTPNSELLEILTRCICLNSDSSLVYVPQQDDEHKGNRIECALLALMERWKIDYEAVRRHHPVKVRLPFSPDWKWMGSLCVVSDKAEVYVKGAVRRVLGMCETLYSSQGIIPLTEGHRSEILTKLLPRWAQSGLRYIAVAFKSAPHSADILNLEGETAYSFFSHHLTLLGVFALRDRIREGAPEAISALKSANVKVRIVTGDTLDTAIAAAKRCGVLPEDYKRGCDFTVMTGPEFEQQVGGLIAVTKAGKVKHWVSNREAFQKVVSQLKVLADSTPLNKYALVTGLHQVFGSKVAVTGRDSHDAPALRRADIGLGLNISGTQIAKEISDIVLVDDEVGRIVTAVKWGRNIYASIRKFMQFQLTVSISVIGISLISAAVCGQVPIAPVQLVWINLIMDTFGALALSTDIPKTPIAPHTPLLDFDLIRTIVSGLAYQLLALVLLFAFGPTLFGIFSSWWEREWSHEGFVHFTLIFHTFVFLQLFNMLNCRCVRMSQFNVFSRICHNHIFLLIVLIVAAVQIIVVKIGGEALHCNSLTLGQQGFCVAFAAGILLARLAGRFIPEKCLKLVSWKLDYQGKTWLGKLLRKKKGMKDEEFKVAVVESFAAVRKPKTER